MRRFMAIAFAITIIFCYCKKDKKGLPAITTSAAINVTANSFSSGGTVTDDGGQPITKRGICWTDHAGPTVADSLTNDGSGGGLFTSSLSGLNANTNYYIKAYASNASGTAYGNEVMVTTAKGVPVVSTTAVTDIQPLTAKTGGNVINDGGASVTERGVVYATTPNPTTANTKIATGTGTGSYTTSLTPLASQQTYYVRAYATNSYGTGYGKQLQFNAASANTVTDIDGNVYPFVSLCGKSWMTANLKTTKYKNGDAITNGINANFNWASNGSGAYTFPNGNQGNNEAYGKLYNLEAVRDSRGVCPTGWHVASDDDWQAVEVCQGMDISAAATLFDRCCGGVKFLSGGTSGVEVKYAGTMFFDASSGMGTYFNFGDPNGIGVFWTGSPTPLGTQFTRGFNPSSGSDYINRGHYPRTAVLSVRCVKD